MIVGKFVGLPISNGVHRSVWQYMIINTRNDVEPKTFMFVNNEIYGYLFDRTHGDIYAPILFSLLSFKIN